MGNIYLCGFMGCGKSSVGAELAPLLGYRFVDMDKYIVGRQNETINEIFSKHGEPYFRRLEEKAARELSAHGGLVVAAGGGSVLNSAILKIFHCTGTVVLLDVPCDTIQKRLAHDKTRPLLNQGNRRAVLKQLYSKRMPLYKNAADITVSNNGGESSRIIARKIFELLDTPKPEL